jgi:hypothetical protein
MKKNKLTKSILAVIAIMALTVGPTLGQEKEQEKWYTVPEKSKLVEQPKPYSPFVDQHFPQQVLFGDSHFHSSLSMDSGLIGNRVSLNDALRYARGEEIITSTGQRAQLIRPLDFLVLSDHAEYLGISDLLNNADPNLLATEVGRKWYEGMQAGGETAWYTAISIVDDPNKGTPRWQDEKVSRSIWESVVDKASEYNQPGAFTALNGYEWTSSAGGNNLHRVVVFRDGPDRVKQVLPFSAFDGLDPEDLWAFMAGYEDKTGGQILAIPHNGNLSNGVMFAETVNDEAMTRDYAERRARWEPLMEVTQMKGDGEAHPFLSPEDEFADFETWDKSNINGAPKEESMLKYEYARSALKVGLQLEQKLGVNPFKSGMIGSSDTHTSLSSTREDNYFGKLPHYEPSAKRFDEVMLRNRADKSIVYHAWELGASGLAAVWARENTREAIFDAMARKEVYAVSGSRIRVRVFAGWDFEKDEVETQNFASEGYKRGVPMGGDLRKAPEGKAPTFMIRAMRDPDNANLDRIQVIKGWLDKKGKTHERIYDVAVSDDREIGKDGRCRIPVGNTIDVANASYTNTIGDPLLTAFWEDPDFDPKQKAFYYVRVIEIPKPRWTAYDAKFFGIRMADEVRMTVQDRAYTSPIWYTPQ